MSMPPDGVISFATSGLWDRCTSMAGHPTVLKELGRRIREWRKKAGYAQGGMISFGFSTRYWQQIEAGRSISVTTLLRICEVLKIKPEDLVRGLEHDPFQN